MRRHLVLVLALPALAACGGGGGSSSPTTGSAPASAVGGSSSPTVAAARQLSTAELKETLPTLEDLPAGFTTSKDDSKDDDEKDKGFLCGADLSNIKSRNAHASSDFAAQEGLSAQQVTVGIGQYDSPDQVDAVVDELATALDKCPSFTSGGDTYTVTPMSAGHLGDRTLGYKMTTKSQGFDIAVNLLVVATGPSVVNSLSASVGLTGSSIGTLTRLTRQTVARYDTAAGIS